VSKLLLELKELESKVLAPCSEEPVSKLVWLTLCDASVGEQTSVDA
jgi:hypothetical protein